MNQKRISYIISGEGAIIGSGTGKSSPTLGSSFTGFVFSVTISIFTDPVFITVCSAGYFLELNELPPQE
ncbi:MAG: hypothetical protein LBQ60_12490 [Bacteroidales bacterium]|jgi:hypothetical protein|nr:hypothetical protein [Bacteroidales bacterium]